MVDTDGVGDVWWTMARSSRATVASVRAYSVLLADAGSRRGRINRPDELLLQLGFNAQRREGDTHTHPVHPRRTSCLELQWTGIDIAILREEHLPRLQLK